MVLFNQSNRLSNDSAVLAVTEAVIGSRFKEEISVSTESIEVDSRLALR